MDKVLFSLGRCVATPSALEALEAIDVQPTELLRRHQCGDWNDMGDADQAANRQAIKNGARVFTSYNLADGKIPVYVITEADRASTTILLPEEY